MSLSGNPVVLGGPASARAGAGVISPDGISATQVAYGSGTNQIKGEAAFVYNETTNTLTFTNGIIGTLLTISDTSGATTGGINFAGDAVLYRPQANEVSTNGNFTARKSGTVVNLGLHAGGSGVLANGVQFVASAANTARILVSGNTAQTITSALDTTFEGSVTAKAASATLGNVVQTLTSPATGDDPTENLFQNRIGTSDATVTTLHTVTIPANTTVFMHATIVARRTGGTAGSAEDGAAYQRAACVKNVAGTATLIGSVASLFTAEDQAGWDCTIDVTSNTARVRVTGAVDNNVTWHLSAIRVSAVST